MSEGLPRKVAIEYELLFWHRMWVYRCCWCDRLFTILAVFEDEHGEPKAWSGQAGDDMHCPFCGGEQNA